MHAFTALVSIVVITSELLFRSVPTVGDKLLAISMG